MSHRLRARIKLHLTILLVVFSSSTIASSKNHFKDGVKLFETEKYSQAAKKFELARKQGLKSTALYYNLGSTYYKTGNYKKSRQYFNTLKNIPRMKSLAEYNLGLIALKLNDITKANNHFKAVIKENKDNKLIYLSQKKLDKYLPDKKPWSVYAGATLGYDDNINIAPVGIVVNESGVFTDYVVAADYVVKGNRKNGWISDFILTNTNYTATNIYDQNQYGVGIKKTRSYNKWNSHVKFSYDKFNYSHEDYLSTFKLETQGKYNWSKNSKIYLKYRYENISSDNALYDYLDGWKQNLRAEYRLYNKKSSSRFYYEMELNDRNDLVTAVTGDEFSYSPTRHAFRLKHTEILNKKWRATGDISYRTSDYPATATQDRNDDRYKLAAYADYRLNKRLQVRYKLEYTDNNSNEAIFDYTRTVYTLGINAFF
ncbi:MAG: hypothetical protein DIZ80_16950 [endosymbiont of Galathealinum brachiosum]|uniref:Uncharacterized protein n=1 Tax=endosymbiont of Galathealinum brachiosum TaxID=2200906 RepID=A0A370D6S4_9GAMM|nr:MAG: hypothetical protein DIZ80_16950 [endosymbiont of Galathealinum brachiosum]